METPTGKITLAGSEPWANVREAMMRVSVGTHMHKGLIWKVLCLVSVYDVFSVWCLFSLKKCIMQQGSIQGPHYFRPI